MENQHDFDNRQAIFPEGSRERAGSALISGSSPIHAE
jgi:hypothetical protein